jgi:hypothetical protein
MITETPRRLVLNRSFAALPSNILGQDSSRMIQEHVRGWFKSMFFAIVAVRNRRYVCTYLHTMKDAVSFNLNLTDGRDTEQWTSWRNIIILWVVITTHNITVFSIDSVSYVSAQQAQVNTSFHRGSSSLLSLYLSLLLAVSPPETVYSVAFASN